MKIRENRKKRMIIINDKWVIGGVILKDACEFCGRKLIYFDKYDCDFCPNCNTWRTEKCGDENCTFCKKRPETPFHEFY